MARKSNKTEHVLKLITKDEEALESFTDKEHQKVEVSIKPEEEKELKIETKLKIEIEPEIEIKPKEVPEKKVTVNIPDKSDSAESAFIEKNEHLVNLAEILAVEKVALVMSRMNVCSCPICVNDVLALALNSLPTKYVTTDAGKQYIQLDVYKKQFETDILAALTKACVRVKASPRH